MLKREPRTISIIDNYTNGNSEMYRKALRVD